MIEGSDTPARIRENYLSYRLNNRELINLAQRLREGKTVDEQLDLYRANSHDESGPYSPEELQVALNELGLTQQFESLKPDKIWSSYERALFRRLSHTEHDPTPFQNIPDQPGSSEFCEVVAHNFEQWDVNHDTRLGAQELDRALARSEGDPKSDAALVLLRSRLNALGSCNPIDGDGISRADLAIFADHGIPGAGILTRKIEEDFQELVQRASHLSQPGPLLQEDFDPEHVNQNRLGSCVLLSTTAGIEAPDVRSMFSQDEFGNAVVTFKNGESEVVGEPTPAERLYHAYSNEGGRWPAILEIATGQYLARKLRPEDGSIRTAADGVPPEEAFSLMAGSDLARVSLDELTPAEARQALQQLDSAPGPKICGSRPELPAQCPERELEFLHNGIENGHAYTFQGYEAKTDQVTLRNPWNRGLWVHASQATSDSSSGGIFKMPFQQFYSSFRWITSSASATEANSQ